MIFFQVDKLSRISELTNNAYDKFIVRVRNVQLILANNFHAAMAVRGDSNSNLHLLQPTAMEISIHKSSVDDPQLPQ